MFNNRLKVFLRLWLRKSILVDFFDIEKVNKFFFIFICSLIINFNFIYYIIERF